MTERRTEDDLRAAFEQAAEQAPATEDVLARLRDAERRPVRAARRQSWRVWLPVTAAAAVIAAIAVPIAVYGGGGNHYSSGSSLESAPANDNAAAPKVAGGSAGASAGSAIGGPTNTAPGGLIQPSPPTPSSAGPDAALCTPGQLTLAFTWAAPGQGTLQVQNPLPATCHLVDKPQVYPLDATGQRLPVQNITTLEGYAGPTGLGSGATASSQISWPSWCGAAAGDSVEVTWGANPAVTVKVTGSPTTPGCVAGRSSPITSAWFSPLS